MCGFPNNLTERKVIYSVDRMLMRLEKAKSRGSEPGVHLNLGAGGSVFEGFINVDAYPKSDLIVKGDLVAPDFGMVDTIYSSHALEHVGHTKSRQALVNWSKCLKPGGKLFLAVPDLREVCRIIADPNTPFDHVWGWYIHTLFGYQTDTNTRPTSMAPGRSHPEDPGQFHLTGFTTEYFERYLPELGFKIDEIFRYDGWSTPSIWLDATRH